MHTEVYDFLKKNNLTILLDCNSEAEKLKKIETINNENATQLAVYDSKMSEIVKTIESQLEQVPELKQEINIETLKTNDQQYILQCILTVTRKANEVREEFNNALSMAQKELGGI